MASGTAKLPESLVKAYRRYAARLGHVGDIQTSPQHDGTPHVEIVAGRYHYVITERGREHERRITADEDELLYWLLSDLVFEIASRRSAMPTFIPPWLLDFRRRLFAHQVRLMSRLRPDWAERKRREIERLLEAFPYKDVWARIARTWPCRHRRN